MQDQQEDLWPCRDCRTRGCIVSVFVSEETHITVGFSEAAARLANLASGGHLLTAAERIYDDGVSGLLRVGPASGVTRLVRAEFLDLVVRDDTARMALRWEARGPAGVLFPALDADITMRPGGADQTVLRLDGAYRAPLGAVGARLDSLVLHRVATATIRAFVGRVAGLIASPPAEQAAPEPGELRPDAAPEMP